MRRWLLLIALGVLTACVPHGRVTPTPMPDHAFTLTVCLTDQDGAPLAGETRRDGIQPTAWTPVPDTCQPFPHLLRANFNVTARADGYSTEVAPVSEAVDQTVTVRLTRTARSNAGESGPLHIEGTTFRRADGSIFPWVGISDFALFARYTRGQDITPVLDQRVDLGFKILRVFGMFDRFGIGAAAGIGYFMPTNTPDYYVKLRAFIELVQSRGLRVEFVALADADRCDEQGTGCLMPTLAEQQAHLTQVVSALSGTWGASVEYGNEVFKNVRRVTDLQADCHAAGLLCAYGIETLDRGQRTMPHLDYVGLHDHARNDDWPRTARALDEIREGFSWVLDDPACRPNCSQHPDNAPEFAGVHVPVVGDEPMGFGLANTRWKNADDAAFYAATAQLMGAGSTYHCDQCVASVLLTDIQLEAAQAWVWGANFPPVEAQLSGYQRGGDCGSAGIGAMPIEHCDLETGAPSRALRSFCKYAFGQEWCVRIRPVGPTIARDGWRITSEPRLGFVTLTR